MIEGVEITHCFFKTLTEDNFSSLKTLIAIFNSTMRCTIVIELITDQSVKLWINDKRHLYWLIPVLQSLPFNEVCKFGEE